MITGLSRREMIRLTAAGAIGVSLAPTRLWASEKPEESFTFIAVNDLHFHDDECRPWFKQVVAQMKESRPEFLLLGGDLAENGNREQMTEVRDIFAKLEAPVYPVIGNHDHQSMDDRGPYDEIFPGRVNYKWEHRGWQLLALDTSDGTKALATTVSDETLHWLDENVPKLDANKPTVVVTHFPLGPFVWGRPVNADEVLDRLAHLRIPAIFSGHFHGYTERDVRQTKLTTDKCCSRFRQNHDGSPEKGWFVCRAVNGAITREFVQFRES